jgi:hypothetical protein
MWVIGGERRSGAILFHGALPQPLDHWSAPKGHARAELHFIFGALAVESHFMPAFSQAD